MVIVEVATIKFFGNLRAVSGTSTSEVSGKNVGDLLQALCEENKALREAIFDGATLRPFVRVMLNGQDIELAQGLDTQVSDSSSIAIFPPIAGG
jgi:MoaD family protein